MPAVPGLSKEHRHACDRCLGHRRDSAGRRRVAGKGGRNSRTVGGGIGVASENVLKVLVRRHVFDSDRPFSAVLYGIFGGISRPDIEALFSELAASTSYEQFSSLVRQAQGSAGLMQFLQLDLDAALMPDGGTPVAYDTVASPIAPHHDAAASEVAHRL